MFKKYVLILLVFPSVIFTQNPVDSLFDALDKSEMQSSIFFNSLLSSSGIVDDGKHHFNTYGFFQAYNELRSGDLLQRFKEFDALIKAQKQSYFDHIIPIGILLAEFDILNPEALNDGSLLIEGNKLKKSSQPKSAIFQLKSKLIAAPFRKEHKGKQLTFEISESLYINTKSSKISNISIDFGDKNGFKSVKIGDVISINYSSTGSKILQFNIQLENGNTYYSTSTILIKTDYAKRDTNGGVISFTSTITPDLSAYGEAISYPGEGEYQIFLDTDNGILDKPIILIDGFDPGDGRDIPGLYSLLDYQGSMGAENLADFVRTQGFDLVIFNSPVYTRAADMAIIDGGSDFIERNAMLLVDIINTINASKVGDEQNVIIGPSMGGLISRYALNYMENNAIDHDTRLWLSFDSPHHGANVPIGMQHQFNFLAYGLEGNSVVELQPLVDSQLKSAAARQMLVDQYESHLANGSSVDFDPSKLLPEPHPWRTIFMNAMNALTANGFPQNTRNVSIINGSGIGMPYQDKNDADINPGFTVVDDTFGVAPLTTAELKVNFTPTTASGSQLISKIKVVFTLILPVTLYDVEANSQAFSYSDGVDAASGGLFDIGGLTAGLDLTGITGDFVAALTTDYFNFIPSVSAMALETINNEHDWFHDIDLGPGSPPSGNSPGFTSNNTPFINWYMPDDNEPHVELTEANVTFALSEIMPALLDTPEFEVGSIRLEQNPVSTEMVLLNTSEINQIDLNIIDLNGKSVFELNNLTLNNKTSIPLNLSSGLYICSVKTSNGLSFNIKLAVK